MRVHLAIAIAVICVALRYAIPEVLECIRTRTDTTATNYALFEVLATQGVGVILTWLLEDRMSWAWALLVMLVTAGFGLLVISANWW